jgi:hypothetical protein
MNTGKCLLLSAGIVALSTGWAAAAPAVARDFLSLRSGPSFKFRVVEVIAIALAPDPSPSRPD